MGDIVTAKELGGYLKIRETTVRKLALEGKIPATRFGKSWRFDLDNILMMISQKGRGRPPRPDFEAKRGNHADK